MRAKEFGAGFGCERAARRRRDQRDLGVASMSMETGSPATSPSYQWRIITDGDRLYGGYSELSTSPPFTVIGDALPTAVLAAGIV